MAHSLVVFQFGDQKIKIPYVAGPSHIANLDEAHLERVISLNDPMTTLMPFDGGVMEIAVVRGDPNVYSRSRLWIKGDRLCIGDSLEKAELLIWRYAHVVPDRRSDRA